MDDLLEDAAAQLLRDLSTPDALRAIEAGGDHRALWQAIEDAGFADALVPEAQGGAGLALHEVFGLLRLCGTHAVPVPLGETVLARGWLARAGVAVPRGGTVFAEAEATADGVVCPLVRTGRVADQVLVARGGAVRLLPVATAQATPAGFVLDMALRWPAQAWEAATPVSGDAQELRLLQAALYAAQLAGALRAAFDRTLAYANERQQFGRPIGKFQAIQHQLAQMAEHVFAARTAAQLGCRATGIVPERLNAAIAKARTSEAALEVASMAHAIHGAIGFTAEFDLQLYTRRLHAWRQAAGSESYWHGVAGRHHLDSGEALVLDTIRAATTVH
ncbi:acyl-CoA dehydrogenase family protein [Pseudorhodoferax sp. Leaf274]|uniref:acyl-CoA dehydrogenase family protein n=1 Tax=Pseudorhodoferax sp. Leaf274 TaxID=1736318 RepID=UPI00070315FC|nr:acyl-CoA dehydrogenase family protein [Pseudorhodoferax sp. Leaf274]KQP47528.1 acyl-CoA dehydrogenase [Pseudorhodoferax sp. Leaf274]